MKQFLSLIVFILVAFTSKAQDFQESVYDTFVVEGKKWNCVHIASTPASKPIPFSYYLKGDTVIGDQACKKMYIEGLSGNTPNYYAAFYEKNKQVYEYPKDSDKPVLTFDHFMKVGEKKMFFGQEQEVIRIDTLKSCNHNFQVVFLYNNTGTSDGLTIVIGGLGGTLYNMFSPTNMVGATNTLVTCEQDGQMIYSTSDINSFVYEEVVGRWFGEWLVKRVQTDVHEPQRPIAVNSTDSLFDLQGRRLQGEPQRKGIYMKGGRKFLRK